jgi:nucleoside-diphosphate-sugar epimerase
MKKKLLICGGNGFQGRNMIEYFLQPAKRDEYEIRATYYRKKDAIDLYGDKVQWVQTDLTKEWDVKKALYGGCDIILQYAAVSTNIVDAINKPYLHVTDNVMMNSLIFKLALESNVGHVVFPSCTVMYEESDSKEDDFKGTIDEDKIYFGGGTTKVYLENMCKFYSKLGNTKYTALRQTNIVGKYDKTDVEKAHFFSTMIQKVKQAEDKIEVWGDGKEQKDLLSVSDLVVLIDLILHRQEEQFELLNVATGKTMPVSEIVEAIVKVSGKDLEIVYDVTKPSRENKLRLDVSRATTKYDWNPYVRLEDVVSELI